MLKIKGKPVKQLSLNHLCKIGLKKIKNSWPPVFWRLHLLENALIYVTLKTKIISRTSFLTLLVFGTAQKEATWLHPQNCSWLLPDLAGVLLSKMLPPTYAVWCSLAK
jgi:hypothetical protein